MTQRYLRFPLPPPRRGPVYQHLELFTTAPARQPLYSSLSGLVYGFGWLLSTHAGMSIWCLHTDNRLQRDWWCPVRTTR